LPEDNAQPFYTSKSQIRLRAGATGSVPVQFLPFRPGQYRGRLLLTDTSVGEFVVDILALATPPAPATEPLRFTCEAKPQVSRDLVLPLVNEQLSAARVMLLERLSGLAKTKARDAMRTAETEALHTPRVFKCRIDSPFYSVPTDITLLAPSGEGGKDKAIPTKASLQTPRGTVGVAGNRVPLVLAPKSAGVYPGVLTLRAPGDVRVFRIEASAVAKAVKTELEFAVPVRQSVSQDIPIVNNTPKDWTLTARISGSPAFGGPTSLRVPAGETVHYPLKFSPISVGNVTGQLVLSNPTLSGDIGAGADFTYELSGEAEEPLAEEHVVVSCQARDSMTHMFRVPNATKEPVTFNVESDIPHVKGASTLTVGPGDVREYQLTIAPQLGGTYSGSLSFVAPNGDAVWFTVEIQAEAPPAEDTLSLEAGVRNAVALEIRLANPLDEPVDFEVMLEGEGLVGDPIFLLGPKETACYELLYAPLVPGESSGSVSFINTAVGEFWYTLELKASPAAPTVMSEMTAPVGQSDSTTLTLENPTGSPAILNALVSNTRNFMVEPMQVSLPPYGTAEAVVTYTPSSLTAEESTTLTFSGPALGDWVYEMSGRGTTPRPMKPIQIAAVVGETATTALSFRNPFGRLVTVAVSLNGGEEKGDESAFALLSRRSRLAVAAFASVQVPFAFHPTSICEEHSMAEVHLEEGTDLTWQFPLHGVAEAPLSADTLTFNVVAREAIETEIALTLPGMPPLAGGTVESVAASILDVPDDYEQLVNDTLTITSVDTTLEHHSTPIKLGIHFAPMRPFEVTAVLVLTKSSGGRWRWPLHLVARPAPPDDTIHIQADVGHTGSVAFKLTNAFLSSSPFTARFSPDSPTDFSVFPGEGVLPPAGSEGASFVLSYSPAAYGAARSGTLLIETAHMRWAYCVKGGAGPGPDLARARRAKVPLASGLTTATRTQRK
jgi:hypothetical protein